MSSNQFATPDLYWKAVVDNVENIRNIPTNKKTQELCNYVAKIRVELILVEEGGTINIPKTMDV